MKTVLVVDDNEAFREMMRLVLEVRGFKVIAAENTGAALSVAEMHPLDAVLTDFEVPEATGLDLCRELAKRSRAMARRLPVWLMTGCTLISAEDALAAGALGLFRKPFHAGEIANAIARYLSEGEPVASRLVVQGATGDRARSTSRLPPVRSRAGRRGSPAGLNFDQRSATHPTNAVS